MSLIDSVPFSHGFPDISRLVICSLLFTNPRVLVPLARRKFSLCSEYVTPALILAWARGPKGQAMPSLVCQRGRVLICGAEELFKVSRIYRAAGCLHKESRTARITLWEGQSWVLVSMMGAITRRISAVRCLWFFPCIIQTLQFSVD